MRSKIVLLMFMTLTVPSVGLSDLVYSEAIDGDLSGNFAAPDTLAFNVGPNQVIGSVGDNGSTGAGGVSGVDRDADYLSFSVPAGQELQSIFVDSYTFSPNFPGSSFIGIVAGTSFDGQGGGDVDNFTFFNASSGEILDNLGGNRGPGEYSIWIQETSPTVVDYAVTFSTVSVVPEPSSIGLLGTAMVGENLIGGRFVRTIR